MNPLNPQALLATLDWGMETLPFPFLLLYVIGTGLAWLLLEAWLTRTARATPGWRKPFPVLPVISEMTAWFVRGSSWLLWIWAVLYFVLVGVRWYEQQNVGVAGVSDSLLAVARTWQQTYGAVIGVLPQPVTQVLPGI